jgi:hypothetical protein
LVFVGWAIGRSDELRADEPAAMELGSMPTLAEIEHFEKRIRPLLHRRCFSCHSEEATIVQGSLRVDSRSLLLSGGDSGPAVVPGKPEESLLVEAIRYGGGGYDMPPEGKLPEAEIELLTQWVRQGAPFPVGDVAPLAADHAIDFEAGRQHWAFQPLARPELPTAATDLPSAADPEVASVWGQGRVDAFVVAALREQNLEPSPPADRATRAPPTPAVALVVGAALGLLAGLTGTGGGIFLTPLLLFAGWASAREAAAVSAAFILVNSIAGLAGFALAGGSTPALVVPMLAFVAVGGALGSFMGARRLAARGIAALLAAVLVIAGAKLLFT